MSNNLDSLIAGRDIAVLEREASAYISSSYHEVLTCRLADGSIRRLLLKRGLSHAQASHGNHGGVPYEVLVYRSVLEPQSIHLPRLHDAFVHPDCGETVMLIDYIENSLRLSKAEPSRLYDAAAWIGAFQRSTESRVETVRSTITCYDEHYYSGWMQRTFAFWAKDHPWLTGLQAVWGELAAEIMTCPTIIHGEFYPKNILVAGGTIVPIDWETCAIAAGEIDLVMLTEGWPEPVANACAVSYCEARWPEGRPASFSRHLLVSAIYAQLLRLGQKKQLLSAREAVKRLDVLNALCTSMGLVP